MTDFGWDVNGFLSEGGGRSLMTAANTPLNPEAGHEGLRLHRKTELW
jgi:hypothetical protein